MIRFTWNRPPSTASRTSPTGGETWIVVRRGPPVLAKRGHDRLQVLRPVLRGDQHRVAHRHRHYPVQPETHEPNFRVL